MGTSHCSEREKKAARHAESGSANSLRTQAGMLSGSDAFCTFSFSLSFVTPDAEMVTGGIFGRLGPSSNRIALPSSLANTEHRLKLF